METQQIVALVSAVLAIGITGTKLWDWWRDARAGQMQKRRAEVDRAITERDKATERADAEALRADKAEAAEDTAARRTRVIEESLAVHRRLIIDAPCLGPSHLPPYPSRKD